MTASDVEERLAALEAGFIGLLAGLGVGATPEAARAIVGVFGLGIQRLAADRPDAVRLLLGEHLAAATQLAMLLSADSQA